MKELETIGKLINKLLNGDMIMEVYGIPSDTYTHTNFQNILSYNKRIMLTVHLHILLTSKAFCKATYGNLL